MDRNHELAEQLVDRIQRALVGGRTDIALKLALDAIKGHQPPTAEQLEESFAEPDRQTSLDHIWRIAGVLFSGQPARWRSLIGKLIKVAGAARALEVVTDCSEQHTEDATSYIGAAIARGAKSPMWRLTDEQLLDECGRLAIATHGKKRPELERLITMGRQREAKTCAGFGEDFING